MSSAEETNLPENIKQTKQIFELDNFLDPSVCDEICGWFKNTPKISTNGGNSLFNGRQINYELIQDRRIKKIVNSFKYDAAFAARILFQQEYLYPDYTDIVLWEEGSGMLVHSDNCDQEGNPNYCAWRTYSGVLYLNDDFLGGETFFPDHGPLFIKPKKGKLAIYPAGLEYNHGVTTVVGNKRYTMPIWFTDNRQYIET